MENKEETAAAAAAMDSNEAERVFKRIDEDGDGKISAAELSNVIRALGSDVTDGEAQVMIQEMDSDRDGFVDVKEFVEFQVGSGGGSGEKLEGELKDAFGMYDLNGNGAISAGELQKVLQRLGEACSVEDCARMIEKVDSNGDGTVNFEEFKRMMTGLKKKDE